MDLTLRKFIPFFVSLALALAFLRTQVAFGVSVDSLSPHQIFQRADTNRADVAIEGTYAGTVTRIEARAVARPGYSGTSTGWRVIDAAPSGGAYASSLTIGAGWYDVEVKAYNGALEVDSTAIEQIGVGEVFIAAGQSNSANYGSPRQSPDDDRVSAATTFAAKTWQHADDPQPTATGTNGSPWPQLGDLIAAKYDVPVGFVSVGVGGTAVGEWLPNGSSFYDTRLKPTIEALGTNGFRAILWHQGESDSVAGTSAATYASRLQSVIAVSRVDAGFDVPWGVAIASYIPNTSAFNQAQIVAGQQAIIDGDPLVFRGALTDDFHTLGYLTDVVHFNQKGLDEHAARWLNQIVSSQIITTKTAPEPSACALLAVGGILLGWRVRRRR